MGFPFDLLMLWIWLRFGLVWSILPIIGLSEASIKIFFTFSHGFEGSIITISPRQMYVVLKKHMVNKDNWLKTHIVCFIKVFHDYICGRQGHGLDLVTEDSRVSIWTVMKHKLL